MKRKQKGFKHIRGYFHRCPFCGYYGNFPDSSSGERQSYGEGS